MPPSGLVLPLLQIRRAVPVASESPCCKETRAEENQALPTFATVVFSCFQPCNFTYQTNQPTKMNRSERNCLILNHVTRRKNISEMPGPILVIECDIGIFVIFQEIYLRYF